MAQLGEDPAGDLASKRREMRVAELIDLYAAEGLVVQRGIRQGQPMKPLTAQYTLSRLRAHVVPLLGARRVSEIVEGDIERMARDIEKGKTATDYVVGPRKRVIVRGGAGAARKVIRDFSAVLSFAMRRRIVNANVVTTASVRKTDDRRERYLSVEEVQRLGNALDDLELAGINPKAANIARLWVLSGCRRNEIAGLKWHEVDLDEGLLRFDDSKTGRGCRPLSGPAVALLKGLREQSDEADEYVFPAERGDGFYQGTKKVWPAVMKKAGLTGVTPHVLRHTFGSFAASAGETLLMIGSLLGHANARSTQIYAHIAQSPAKLAAERISSSLAEALGQHKRMREIHG